MKERRIVKFFCSTWFLSTLSWLCWSQHSYTIPENVPAESLVVHVNTSFLLTGETLLFKVLCLEQDTPAKFSRLSSIAYFELVGEDGQPIAQLKVKLKNGAGSGDYFLDANVPTGNYTLIGYTKWMRNFSELNFFRRTITIINPKMKPSEFTSVNTRKEKDNVLMDSNYNTELSGKLNRETYERRQKVTLDLRADAKTALTLSVNVRSADGIGYTSEAWSEPSNKSQIRKPQIHFLPDLKGEVISGTAHYAATGKPLINETITLSSPSKHFAFNVSTTDSLGRYYFSGNDIEAEYFLLRSDQHRSEELRIENDGSFLGQYDQFVPPQLALNKDLKTHIENRLLSAEIENAFYEVKKDSILAKSEAFPFYITANKIYDLDDFARFPTMEDVFREIIPQVVVKARNGNFSLIMANSTTGFRFANPPLVLIDGIPITDADEVIKYDPMLIHTISLVTERYYYGALKIDGIVSIETYDGKAKNLAFTDMVRVDYVVPQPAKIYYSPEYDSSHNLSRIPDFRTQLYWNPGINLASGETKSISFFSNDRKGKYFVEIVGVSSKGTTIYWREEFVIK